MDDSLYKVCRILNRYIVPFEFQGKFDFDTACKRIDDERYTDDTCWIRSRVSPENQGDGEDEDDDIFEYLMDEFSITERDSLNHKLGCHWRYQNTCDGNRNTLGFLYHEAGSDFKLNVSISDMGLYVFRTGIGILWYEADISTVDGQPINNLQLEKFQHIFKELNDDIHIRMWMDNCITWQNDSEEIDRLLRMSAEAFGDNDTISKIPDEKLPFSMGNWIAEKLGFLDIAYFSQRKSHYAKDLATYYAQSRRGRVMPSSLLYNTTGNREEREALLNKWKAEVQEVLERSDFQSKFPPICPDKSLLFSYVFFVDDSNTHIDDEKARIAYILTNGYDRKVKVADNVINKMETPFSNVIWYATREGCGYYAFSGENDFFFKNVAARKIRVNYFTLYIRVLYQSYSLLRFNHLLAGDKIYADYKHYMSTEEDPYIDKKLQVYLSSLRSMINVFLLKSTVTSVSHIQHQNEFYSYLEKQLFIEEDIDSVSMGLDVLDDLVKEQLKINENKRDAKKHNNLEAFLAIVTIFTLASTISDSHTFLKAWRVDHELLCGEGEVYVTIIVALFVVGCWIFFRRK